MIRTRGRGAVYGEVWFDEEPPADPAVDIVRFRQRPEPVANARCAPFLSLVIDLCADEDEIAGGFGKNCRYKIKRAEAKDGLQPEFVPDPAGRLDEFCVFYDAFARQKSLQPADRRWLAAACQTRQLALSAASRNGEALVWHAHVMSGVTAQLYYSGSSRGAMAGDDRALVGRANRWLHWQDMLRFKRMGMKRYDWGGLFEDESVPERTGLNRFKKDFGGREQRSYDCTLPVSLRGRVWLPLRDAWRRWHPSPPARSTGA